MKKIPLHYILYAIIYISISTCPLQGQNSDTIVYEAIYDSVAPKNDLLEFPLKDLMNIKVTVASKKEEKISDAPSSITAYSSKEIENLGYYTLSDLAQITSGYSVNYQYGETGFETRGQTANGFNNNKHLLLIDGIPVNFARSYKAQISEELPVFFAQRVEFLKGPASALYGASAFYGAVSIISKDPISNGTIAESKFSAGNWDNNKRFMANILHRSNKGISALNVGYFQKNASRDFIGVIDNPNYRYWDQNNSIFFKASHRITRGFLNGLSLGVIYMRRTSGLGETWGNVNVSSEVNTISWQTLVPYLKYQRQINKKLILNSYLKGNNSIEAGYYQLQDKPDSLKAYNSLSLYKSNVINIEGLAELRYEFNTRNSLTFGLNYDRRVEQGNPSSYAYSVGYYIDTTKNNPSFPLSADFAKKSFSFNTISGYAQYQRSFDYLSGLTVTGGLRYDVGFFGTYNFKQLSPRIAIVQKITPKLNLKIMTGRALRAPGIKEIGLATQFLDELNKKKIPVPAEVKPIKAEVIQTYEAGLVYNMNSMQLSATFFHNTTTNEIGGKILRAGNGQDTVKGNWITNLTGTTVSRGFEVDFLGVINNHFRIFSNFAYALAKNQDNNYFSGIPLSKFNIGITHISHGKFKLKSSVVAKYIYGYIKGGTDKSVQAGHTFIDANFIIPVTENLNFELQVKNILNQKVLFPTSGIPLPGRTYQISLGLKF